MNQPKSVTDAIPDANDNSPESDQGNQVIGRVAATKMQGNNSREFYFWVEPDTRLNPLDLVLVRETMKEGEEEVIFRTVYAQVLDISSHTDAESFLEIFASTDFGNVALKGSIDRVAFSVAKAQVLGVSNGIRMPVVFNSPVFLADEAGILELLKVSEVKEGKLPIGYIEQSNKVKVPVKMEVKWLTGPDGAHLNVSGKTRLAAKTSYVLFLVSSILQTQDDTAVIIFNVKGSDLLQIHEPNKLLAAEQNKTRLDELDQERLDELKDAWESMGLEPKPFDKDKVYYFLPSQKNDPNQVNADLRNLPVDSGEIVKQPENYFVYRYGLPQVRGRLRLLLSSQGPNDTQEQFIGTLDNNQTSFAWTKSTFKDMCAELQKYAEGDRQYLNTWSSTIRVVNRFIQNVTTNRTTGVFDYELPTFASARWKLPSDFIKESLEAGQTLVVDITRVNEYEQQWIFGDVLKAVEKLKVEGRTRSDGKELPCPPQKIVIFVDELNKYAPIGQFSPLIYDILDITARGGSLGIILFGAEQFASRIHPQVYGNCANKAYGLTDPTEVGTDPYRSFPKEIRDRLSELQRGELIASFDFFGQPLRIKFPPPVCRKQEDVS